MKKPIYALLFVCAIFTVFSAAGMYCTARIFKEKGLKEGLNMGYRLCEYEHTLKDNQLTDSLDSVSRAIDQLHTSDETLNVYPKK